MAKGKYGDRKWRDEFYVTVYKLAREGLSEDNIARAIGVNVGIFKRWKDEKPAFALAISDGRSHDPKSEHHAVLYNRLHPQLQDVWDRVEAVEESPNENPEVRRDKRRCRLLIDDEVGKMTVVMKQRLFVHAWVLCDYSKTEACRKTGISISSVQDWAADAHFVDLVKQTHEAKKDLFESALVGLVKQGEPSAVVFANKTLNRDRGYNDKVEVTHVIGEQHSVDELGLTLDQKKEILAAIRDAQTKKLPDNTQVLEAEFVEVHK